MKKITQLFSAFLSVVMLSQFSVLSVLAEEQIDDNTSQTLVNTPVQSIVDLGINYLEFNRDEYGVWSTLSDNEAANVIDSIESLNKFGIPILKTEELIDASAEYFEMLFFENVNDLSCILILDSMQNDADVSYLKDTQNPDGGFGLALRLLFAK